MKTSGGAAERGDGLVLKWVTLTEAHIQSPG